MLRLWGPGLVGLVVFLFWIYCIFDVISTDEVAMRNLPKLPWLLIVLFFNVVGGLAWFLLGRPEGTTFAVGSSSYRGATSERRHVAPDDDPEFLKRLDERRLHNWEAELKRREDELRRREQGGDTPD